MTLNRDGSFFAQASSKGKNIVNADRLHSKTKKSDLKPEKDFSSIDVNSRVKRWSHRLEAEQIY
jgi:hypothetical protein